MLLQVTFVGRYTVQIFFGTVPADIFIEEALLKWLVALRRGGIR